MPNLVLVVAVATTALSTPVAAAPGQDEAGEFFGYPPVFASGKRWRDDCKFAKCDTSGADRFIE